MWLDTTSKSESLFVQNCKHIVIHKAHVALWCTSTENGTTQPPKVKHKQHTVVIGNTQALKIEHICFKSVMCCT